MSNEKLSELSKPAAWEVKGILCHSEEEAQVYVGEPEPLYSQEYVSALLAELEASKQYAKERDAENESLALTVGRLRVELHNEGAANAHAYERIRGLEKRLATPVRLPDVLFIKVSGSAVPVMHAERVKERLRSAGFKCVGDE